MHVKKAGFQTVVRGGSILRRPLRHRARGASLMTPHEIRGCFVDPKARSQRLLFDALPDLPIHSS
jgi:hypothetical protein